MQVKFLKFESELYGSTVKISKIVNAEEIVNNQERIIKKYNPTLIYCMLPAGDIRNIRLLEKKGYEFSEFRIHSVLQMNDYKGKARTFPYELMPIGNEKYLDSINLILDSTTPDDRFYNDPDLNVDLARRRETENINKSFRSWPNEFILGLINTQKDNLVAFRSGSFINEKEVFYYLYGVSQECDHDLFSRMLDHLSINYLFERGVRLIHTISTGFNTLELNRLILHHGFRIESAEVVLRWKSGIHNST